MVEPHGPERKPHAPTPSLWPVGFAAGIAVLLTGVILNWIVLAIGAALTVLFGFLWVRDVTAGVRAEPGPREETRPGAAPVPPGEGVGTALPLADEEEVERFPRSVFLEGATLGLGGLIGGLVTVPIVGFAIAPAFVDQRQDEVDIGALDAFPEGQWVVVTFLSKREEGNVSTRTAYIRYNGLLGGEPSFTMISNRCVHLGCPVQPGGPVEENAEQREGSGRELVVRTPTEPANFACPCHGGVYDLEGNRTAGPPVRALDRYAYAIRDGRVILTSTYSVGEVRNEGKNAIIIRYDKAQPGVHVDGPEQIFYPLVPRE